MTWLTALWPWRQRTTYGEATVECPVCGEPWPVFTESRRTRKGNEIHVYMETLADHLEQHVKEIR